MIDSSVVKTRGEQMKSLGISALALMLSLSYAAAQDDASDASVPTLTAPSAPAAPVETITDKTSTDESQPGAEPQPSGASQRGGGEAGGSSRLRAKPRCTARRARRPR